MHKIVAQLKFVQVLAIAAIVVAAILFIQSYNGSPKKLAGDVVIIDPSPARSSTPFNAEKLFKENCTSCHAMETVVVGPALKGVTERIKQSVFSRFLLYPEEMINQNYYLHNQYLVFNKEMHPDFKKLLTEEDVSNIASYLGYGAIR